MNTRSDPVNASRPDPVNACNIKPTLTMGIKMYKFLFGAAFSAIVLSAFFYIFSFQLFKSPTPINGDQLKKIWLDSERDSHSRWRLVEATPEGFVFYLEYPIKRYKFFVPRGEIILKINTQSIPITIRGGDISLTTEPEHFFSS